MHSFVAHSDNKDAVQRTARLHNRAAVALCLLLALLLTLVMSIMSSALSSTYVHWLANIQFVLIAAALVSLSVAALSRRALNPYLKRGEVLRVDESTLRGYRRLVKQTGTHFNYDELFNRQRELNATAKRWDDLHRERYGRRQSAKV